MGNIWIWRPRVVKFSNSRFLAEVWHTKDFIIISQWLDAGFSVPPPPWSKILATPLDATYANWIRMAPAAYKVAAGRRRGLGKLDLLVHSSDILNHCF
jgi:hypothetical protein